MRKLIDSKENNIAQKYFKLLIEKHRVEGYNLSIVKEEIQSNAEDYFYMQFTKDNSPEKLYKIYNSHFM